MAPFGWFNFSRNWGKRDNHVSLYLSFLLSRTFTALYSVIIIIISVVVITVVARYESTFLPVFRVFACHYIMTVKRQRKKPQQRPTIWFRFYVFFPFPSRMSSFGWHCCWFCILFSSCLVSSWNISNEWLQTIRITCIVYIHKSPCVSSFYFKMISSCHFPSYRVITV